MGFEKMVRQSRYVWYQKNREMWPEYFANADIPVQVHVMLRRGGYLQ